MIVIHNNDEKTWRGHSKTGTRSPIYPGLVQVSCPATTTLGDSNKLETGWGSSNVIGLAASLGTGPGMDSIPLVRAVLGLVCASGDAKTSSRLGGFGEQAWRRILRLLQKT